MMISAIHPFPSISELKEERKKIDSALHNGK